MIQDIIFKNHIKYELSEVVFELKNPSNYFSQYSASNELDQGDMIFVSYGPEGYWLHSKNGNFSLSGDKTKFNTSYHRTLLFYIKNEDKGFYIDLYLRNFRIMVISFAIICNIVTLRDYTVIFSLFYLVLYINNSEINTYNYQYLIKDKMNSIVRPAEEAYIMINKINFNHLIYALVMFVLYLIFSIFEFNMISFTYNIFLLTIFLVCYLYNNRYIKEINPYSHINPTIPFSKIGIISDIEIHEGLYGDKSSGNFIFDAIINKIDIINQTKGESTKDVRIKHENFASSNYNLSDKKHSNISKPYEEINLDNSLINESNKIHQNRLDGILKEIEYISKSVNVSIMTPEVYRISTSYARLISIISQVNSIELKIRIAEMALNEAKEDVSSILDDSDSSILEMAERYYLHKSKK